jgi:hypothetical protein
MDTKITLYLDMDGVLSNFEKAYRAMWNEFKFDRERFREAVMERKIFSHLELMPNADKFLAKIREIESGYGSHLNIEMLTSVGTHRTDMGNAGREQKTEWLLRHDINYKPNFVCSKPEKANYAGSRKLLVDDHSGCIDPFNAAGGVGLLHLDDNYLDTVDRIYWYLDEALAGYV